MGNIFDQFDEPESSTGNIFDQFDPTEEVAPDLVTAPASQGGVGRVTTGVSNIGRSAVQMATGVPKSIAIQHAQGAQETLGLFDRMDQGEELSVTERVPFGFELDMSNYKSGTAEERQALRAKVSESLDPNANVLYEAGESVDKAVAEALPVNPEYDEEFWAGDVSKGIGSMLGFMGVGSVARRTGMPAGPSVAVPGMSLGSVEGFEDALSSGATITEAYESANLNGVVGVTEAIPIANMFKRLDKLTGGVISTAIKNAMKQGTEEAIQEAFQTIMSNVIANNENFVGYDQERGTFTGAERGGAVGFTTGGIMGFITSAILGGRRRGGARDETVNRLTQGDLDSDLPNADIQQGKAAIDELLTPNILDLADNPELADMGIIDPGGSERAPYAVDSPWDVSVKALEKRIGQDPYALVERYRGITPDQIRAFGFDNFQRIALAAQKQEAMDVPGPTLTVEGTVSKDALHSKVDEQLVRGEIDEATAAQRHTVIDETSDLGPAGDFRGEGITAEVRAEQLAAVDSLLKDNKIDEETAEQLRADIEAKPLATEGMFSPAQQAMNRGQRPGYTESAEDTGRPEAPFDQLRTKKGESQTAVGGSERPFQGQFEEGRTEEQEALFRNRAEQKTKAERDRMEEDLEARWKEREAREKSRQEQNKQAWEETKTKYGDQEYTEDPGAPDADGFWNVDEDEFLRSSDGKIVRFKTQKDAAKWLAGNSQVPNFDRIPVDNTEWNDKRGGRIVLRARPSYHQAKETYAAAKAASAEAEAAGDARRASGPTRALPQPETFEAAQDAIFAMEPGGPVTTAQLKEMSGVKSARDVTALRTSLEARGLIEKSGNRWIVAGMSKTGDGRVTVRDAVKHLVKSGMTEEEARARVKQVKGVARVGGKGAWLYDIADLIPATEANINPSEAQKKAGNYKKDHVNVQGLDISVENPVGSKRTGIDPDGKPWDVVMSAPYGYIKRTEGADGDQVDVYIGPRTQSQKVFVVDQKDLETGEFDEHKVIVGTAGEAEARMIYEAHFSDGKGSERIDNTTEMTMDEFKIWLKEGDTTKPAYVEAPKVHTPHYAKNEGQRNRILVSARAQLEKLYPGRVTVDPKGGTLRIKRGTNTENLAAQKEVARQTDNAIKASERGRKRGAPKRKRTLLTWISERGGITGTKEGDFANFKDWHKDKPGMSKIIRETTDLGEQGDLEGARAAETDKENNAQDTLEAAYDAGFFPELDGQDLSQLNAVDILNEAMRREEAGDPSAQEELDALEEGADPNEGFEDEQAEYEAAQSAQEEQDFTGEPEDDFGEIPFQKDKDLFGEKPVTDKERAEEQMKGPKKTEVAQKGIDGLTLFDEDSRTDVNQGDLPFEKGGNDIPIDPAWTTEKMGDSGVMVANHPKNDDNRRKVQRQVSKLIRKVTGGKVNVKVVDLIGTPEDGVLRGGALGAFHQKGNTIYVSLQSLDKMGTARHEVIHFLKRTGVINDARWKVLERRGREWRTEWEIDKLYSDKTKEEQIEEAIAEGYRKHESGELTAKGITARIFDSIKQFIEGVQNIISSGEFITAKGVFAEVESGKYAGTEGTQEGEDTVAEQVVPFGKKDKRYFADAIAKAKTEGHDGLVYRNKFEDLGSDSYVVFDGEQVRSVDEDTVAEQRRDSAAKYLNKGAWKSTSGHLKSWANGVLGDGLSPSVYTRKEGNRELFAEINARGEENPVGYIEEVDGKFRSVMVDGNWNSPMNGTIEEGDYPLQDTYGDAMSAFEMEVSETYAMEQGSEIMFEGMAEAMDKPMEWQNVPPADWYSKNVHKGNAELQKYHKAMFDQAPFETDVTLPVPGGGDLTVRKMRPTLLEMQSGPTLVDDTVAEQRPRLRKSTTPSTAYERLSDADKTIWEKAAKKGWHTLKRAFFSAGNLPGVAFDAKIKKDSMVNFTEMETRMHIANLEQAMGVKFHDMTKAEQDMYDRAMRGDVDPSLRPEVKESIFKMRQYVDALTTQYVDILETEIDTLVTEVAAKADTDPAALRAAVDKLNAVFEQGNDARTKAYKDALSAAKSLGGKESIETLVARVGLQRTLIANTGKYVNRSYRAFDDPKWVDKVPEDVFNDAQKYLMAEHDMTEAKAEEYINLLLKEGTAFDGFEAYIKGGKLGAKDLSILKKRTDVHPKIRALLGEHTDPRLNFARSTTKMSNLIFNTHFLNEVLEKGKDVFLFKKDKDGVLPRGATKQIVAAGTKAMEPLDGYYTYPEVEQAFRDALGKDEASDFLRMVIQANGMVKYGKTVLSPTTGARNYLSGYFFTVHAGHFNYKHLGQAGRSMKAYFANHGGGDAYLRNLTKLGVTYDSPFAGELAKLLEDSKMEDIFLQGSTAGNITRATFDKLTKFYQFGDDMPKIVGFENELMSLMKGRSGINSQSTEAEILAARKANEKEAAYRIRNTYPTYSMVGRGIRKLRKFPLVGTFVSFPAEIIRTHFNSIKIAAQDLADPQMRLAGARRVAGITIASSVMYAVAQLSKALYGVDDDEEEAIRMGGPSWSENSNILFAGRDEKGNPEMFDLTFLDPYGYFQRPITAMLRDQPLEDAAIQAGRELLEPFLGTDIAFQGLTEIWQNKKESGGRVYNPEDTAEQQSADVATHLRKSLQPGAVALAERTIKAITGDKTSYGKQYKLNEEMLAFVGFRKSTFEPLTSIKFRTYEFTDRLKDSSAILNKTLRDQSGVSDDQILESLSVTRAAREDAYGDFSHLVAAAIKVGATKSQVFQVLRANKISALMARRLVDGKPMPKWSPTLASIRGEVKSRRAVGEDEAAKELIRRWKVAKRG